MTASSLSSASTRLTLPPLWLKICGVTQAAQARVIAQLGVSAIGLIGVPGTPRYLDLSRMEAVAAAIPPGIPAVGVFMNLDLATLSHWITTAGLTGVQLHGQESPAFCDALRAAHPQCLLIKALRPRSLAELNQAADYAAVVDYILIDAYHPEVAGGSGTVGNWDLLSQWDPPCPWILAGGLNRHTIPQALQQLRPYGLDLSSGVELSPGVKNLDEITALVGTVVALPRHGL